MTSIRLDRVKVITHRKPNLTHLTRVISVIGLPGTVLRVEALDLDHLSSNSSSIIYFCFYLFFCLPSTFTGSPFRNTSSLFGEMILSLQLFGSKGSSSSYSWGPTDPSLSYLLLHWGFLALHNIPRWSPCKLVRIEFLYLQPLANESWLNQLC